MPNINYTFRVHVYLGLHSPVLKTCLSSTQRWTQARRYSLFLHTSLSNTWWLEKHFDLVRNAPNSTSEDLGSNCSFATGSGHGQFSKSQNNSKTNSAYFTWFWISNENVWESTKGLNKCKSFLSSTLYKDLENIL